MFHNVFNLILEYLVLPTYSIHSAHDSLIDRFGLRSFSIAVLLIHIDKITGKGDTIRIGFSRLQGDQSDWRVMQGCLKYL